MDSWFVFLVLEAPQQLERPVGPVIARTIGVHVVETQHGHGTPAGSPAERIFCRRLVHGAIPGDGHRVAEGPAVHAEERLPRHRFDADELTGIADDLDRGPGFLAQGLAVAHPRPRRLRGHLRRDWPYARDAGTARLRQCDVDCEIFRVRTGPRWRSG